MMEVNFVAKKRKRARAQLPAPIAPNVPVRAIEAVEPSINDVVSGTVSAVELLPDGSRRLTYQPLRSVTQAADGTIRWDYFRPDEL